MIVSMTFLLPLMFSFFLIYVPFLWLWNVLETKYSLLLNGCVTTPPHHLSTYHWKLRSSALSHNFTLSISVTWFSLSLLLLWVYWFKAAQCYKTGQPTNQPAGDPDPSMYKHTQQSDDLQSNRRSSSNNNNNNVDNLTIYTSSRSSSSNNDNNNNNDDINDFNCQSPILTQSSARQRPSPAALWAVAATGLLASQLAGTIKSYNKNSRAAVTLNFS